MDGRTDRWTNIFNYVWTIIRSDKLQIGLTSGRTNIGLDKSHFSALGQTNVPFQPQVRQTLHFQPQVRQMSMFLELDNWCGRSAGQTSVGQKPRHLNMVTKLTTYTCLLGLRDCQGLSWSISGQFVKVCFSFCTSTFAIRNWYIETSLRWVSKS